MTVTAPPLDTAGALIDAEIATIQGLVDTALAGPVDHSVAEVLYQYIQLLNQVQVEAVDHYMVTGWLNAATILAQYSPQPAWDEHGQELQARVAYLQALVNSPPVPPPGNADGYGGSGWVTVLQNYQQQLYAAQITLVEHMMDTPGGTTAATILAGMSGFQSFPFAYTSTGSLPLFPNIPPVQPPPPPPPPPPPAPHSVRGTLTGLAPGNTIVLGLNGANNITLTTDGFFTFAAALPVGTPYSVTVLTAPLGQPVTIIGGTGIMAGSDVNVQVVVGTQVMRTIGGTLSGLTGLAQVVLQNNGGDDLSIGSNGAFTFLTPVPVGHPYSVTVLSSPAGQNVAITNGAGVVGTTNVTNVSVTCAAIATYTISGTLNGLPLGNITADDLNATADSAIITADVASATITLQNNGGDDLLLTANGSFTFATQLLAGAPYAITVLTAPAGETTTVVNGVGTVGNSNVTNPVVNCTPMQTFSVGGTLTGLSQRNRSAGNASITADSASVTADSGPTSITLQNNGGDNIVLTADGPFVFPAGLFSGASYAVTVLTPPAGLTVSLSNASGVIVNSSVTNVAVTCGGLPTFTIGGTLSNLPGGKTITLQNNGGDNITLSSNGAFTFATPLLGGAAYSVTVLTPPSGDTAIVTAGTGTVGSSNVTGVGVACVLPPNFSLGGTLSALPAGGSITLQNNGGDNLTLNANGAFTFPTQVASGATYAVTVLTPPAGGSAIVTNGSGTMPSANVTNVGVACTAPSTFTVGGNLTSLAAGGSVVLQNNGGDNLTVSANGPFTFATALLAGASYAVTVLTQPAGQICTITAGSGTIGSSNVTNVAANCTAVPTYQVGGTLSGLSAGAAIVLQNNGGDNLTLNANGAFHFPTTLLSGASYAVTVLTAPAGETAGVTNGTGVVGNANVTSVAVDCTLINVVVRRFRAGVYVAISYPQMGGGPSGGTLSPDTGTFNYSAGTASTPLTISGNYSAGTMPGGKNGTGTSSNCTTGTGTGGHTLSRAGTGPCVNTQTTQAGTSHRTQALVPRYPWADLEPSQLLTFTNSVGGGASGTLTAPLTDGNYTVLMLKKGTTFNFTGSVGGATTGTLTGAITNGNYTVLFSNGEARYCQVTTGTTVSWSDALNAGSITTAYSYNPAVAVTKDVVVSGGTGVAWSGNLPSGSFTNAYTFRNYDFTQMDADLAQCIALDVYWFPMVVIRSFGPADAPPTANGNPLPLYMRPYVSTFAANSYQLWRWDSVNVTPNMSALFTAIGQRYDLCSHFGGIATQETSNGQQDTAAHNWTSGKYLAGLSAESDAIASASPNSRHLALQNFGGNEGPVMIDQYAAYIQKNGAILAGPDLTLCTNGVYNSCYTSGTGKQIGRYGGYRFGGVIGSGVNFKATGPTGCSIQRAEWIGIAPGCLTGQAVQDSLDYLLGSTTVGLQPNFLSGQVLLMDWHQGAGVPNNQQFTGAGITLINSNALSRFQTWTVV